MWTIVFVFLLLGLVNGILLSRRLTAASLPGHHHSRLSGEFSHRMRQRCTEMSSADSQWGRCNSASLTADLSGTSIVSLMGRTYDNQCFGPLKLDVHGDTFLIFDWQLVIRHGKSLATPVCQTVVTMTPQGLDVPQFYLRPHDYSWGARWSCYESVDTQTALDASCAVESLLPYRTKALFQSEFGRTMLTPYVVDRRWTVEWTGTHLVVYKQDTLIAPHDLRNFAGEVMEFGTLLGQGGQAYSEFMDQRLELAAHRASAAHS